MAEFRSETSLLVAAELLRVIIAERYRVDALVFTRMGGTIVCCDIQRLTRLTVGLRGVTGLGDGRVAGEYLEGVD